MSLNSVQSFVIENCNGPTIENGLNNVCLHPLSRTFTFRTKSICSSTFGNAELHIRENLTRNRKMLYHQARIVKQELNFMYLWTSQGKIRLRKYPDSRIITINSLADLSKLKEFYLPTGR